MTAEPPLSHGDYTVGWICALPLEMAAAKLMLDTIHPSLPRSSTDQNTYILGSIGEHNIVIGCLPVGAYGTVSAATVTMQLLSTFHSIRFGLMVGIGGGAPTSNTDIRLGDIVVSQPADTFGGVIQYDFGKALSGGQFQRTGMLNRPPKVLLTALATLKAHHLTEGSRILDFVSEAQGKMTPHRAANFARPTQEDCLYQAEYAHVGSDTCVNCDQSKLVARYPRSHKEPIIHYGLIASANQVVKDGRLRDKLTKELGVYCVEMEAAGLMNDFPCLVIRGICDYADSHKNKEWQGYAANVAAAYATELLSIVPVDLIDSSPIAQDTLAVSAHRFNVPLDLTAVPVVERFVGRQDDLNHLWQYLQPTYPPSRKVAILHGLGGMGKTQLAIRLAREHKYDFTAIFWLNGKDRGTLLQSLSSVLPRLPGQSQDSQAINDEEVEQRARHVLRWLALEGNSRWLVIFDNIDQYSPTDTIFGDAYDIEPFFPTVDHGSILITSRLRGLIELGTSFPLDKLEYEDASQLLLQSSRLSTPNTRNTESNIGTKNWKRTFHIMLTYIDTIALANRLDGLPLAIVVAGAFMRETGTSITEYLRYYQESWADLQAQSSPGRQYKQGNLLQTWMISYREILKRDPDAAQLLLLLAHFENRDIWYELVEGCRDSSTVPSWLERAISSGLAFKTKVKSLIGFSLLETKQQEGSYAMHPVVQDWCFHVATTDKNVNAIRLNELALVSVGNTVPSSSDRDYAALQRRLIPHANNVSRGIILSDDIAVWSAFDGLGNLYSDQANLEEAKEMYERALTGKEKTLGPSHTSTLNTVNNLGNLYADQGKLEEAEEMYARALAGREKVLGLAHTSTLNTVNNLGILYKAQERLEEAEEMYQRALVGYEKTLGPDHTSTLNTVNNLGILYKSQGKLKEAEEMYERALTGKEKALGPAHTSTLNTVNNLGILYKAQGRLEEAEEMYQRALIGYEKALGPDHTSTLNTVNNLGKLSADQGKLEKAEELYKLALAGYEKALGQDHKITRKLVMKLNSLSIPDGESD